jgi:hypothetical protein
MADIVFPGQAAGGPLGRDYLPENYDLELYKGDYFAISVTLKNDGVALNLTGYTGKCSIRQNYDAVETFDADCTIDPLVGQIDIVFPSSVTSTIDAGTYIWDFQLTNPDGNNRTYFAGDVTVFGEVTE